jgi:tetratricopeptide (TPR) repeat protein
MRHLIIFVLILISIDSFGQENRLAWVIGNSNYNKGELKNPVNDALLMAKTLRNLNFTVILDTNIATLAAFNSAALKFGDERGNYNVALIYYAGHGVQIKDVNYLLPTKEEYLNEKHVEFNAMSLQKIMSYLEERNKDVNILILDACRNNPFENEWKSRGVSLQSGKGLAKVNAPIGSLIAYSTDAGNVAADGAGENSVYCNSLVKNMQLEDVSLDQVFRNVRTDVLSQSDGRQRPIESSQLTGETFYLKKITFIEKLLIVDSLIENENYNSAILKCGEILSKDSTNKKALLKLGKANYLSNKNYDGIGLTSTIKLFPNDVEPYIEYCEYLINRKQLKAAKDSINSLISRIPQCSNAYLVRAKIFIELKQPKNALNDCNYSLSIDSNNTETYFFKSQCLINHYKIFDDNQFKSFDEALLAINKAIFLNPLNKEYYFLRGSFISNYLNKRELALQDFNKMLQVDSLNQKALNAIGVTYKKMGNLDLALSFLNKSISIGPNHPFYLGLSYQNRAAIYEQKNMLDSAENDYNLAIKVNEDHSGHYYQKAVFLLKKKKSSSEAITYLSMAINKKPTDNYYFERADIYETLANWELAINDYFFAYKADYNNIKAIRGIAKCYSKLNQQDSAFYYYEMGTKLPIKDSTATARHYYSYAKLLFYNKKYIEAINSLKTAIKLKNDRADYYYELALMYQNIPYKLKDERIRNILLAKSTICQAVLLEDTNPIFYYYRYQIEHDDNNKEDSYLDINKALALSNNDAIYLAERGNYYRSYKEYDLAENDFNAAIKKDSQLLNTYHYQILLLKDKGQIKDAIKRAEQTISKFKNDTVSNYLLGEIYLEQKEYLKSLKYFNNAISIMEFDSTYQTKELEIKLVYPSNIYQRVGEVYKLLGDNELTMEYYSKALDALNDEVRPDKTLKLEEIQELMSKQ